MVRISTVPDKEQASQGSQYNKIQAGGAKHAAKVPMILLFLSFSSLLRNPVQLRLPCPRWHLLSSTLAMI